MGSEQLAFHKFWRDMKRFDMKILVKKDFPNQVKQIDEEI